MSIDAYLSVSLGPRYLQPRVRLRSSLAGTGFYSSGPVAHFQLGDQAEQEGVAPFGALTQALRSPLGPQLYSVFEADLTRVYTSVVRRLRHQQANQVVSQQANPQLLLNHMWSQAAEHFKHQRRLDVSQIQL